MDWGRSKAALSSEAGSEGGTSAEVVNEVDDGALVIGNAADDVGRGDQNHKARNGNVRALMVSWHWA
jgi:hypothetical protein